MNFNGDIGIQSQKPFPGTFGLGCTHLAFVMENLSLEVGKIDGIIVYKADPAHPRRGEIQQRRRAQPARADDQEGSPRRGGRGGLALHRERALLDGSVHSSF